MLYMLSCAQVYLEKDILISRRLHKELNIYTVMKKLISKKSDKTDNNQHISGFKSLLIDFHIEQK